MPPARDALTTMPGGFSTRSRAEPEVALCFDAPCEPASPEPAMRLPFVIAPPGYDPAAQPAPMPMFPRPSAHAPMSTPTLAHRHNFRHVVLASVFLMAVAVIVEICVLLSM